MISTLTPYTNKRLPLMSDTQRLTPNDRARAIGEMNKQASMIDKTTLPERIKIYADAWINNPNKRDAYAAAGYSCPTYSNAAIFHSKYQKEINQHIHEAIHDKVPLALGVLQEIMLHGKSETARVKAGLEILDRAGYSKDTKIHADNTEPKTHAELQSELRKLLEGNSPEAKYLESGG